jgi:thiol:disulfide interchange protein
MKRVILSLTAAISLILFSSAQIIDPVKWNFHTRQVDENEVDLIFKADISSRWHMYGLNIPENGPIPVTITFNDTIGFKIVGKLSQSPNPEIIDDKIFNMKLELHHKQVTFVQRIRKIHQDSIFISGVIEYMTCSDMQCIPGDKDFSFKLKGTDKLPATPITSSFAENTEDSFPHQTYTDSSSVATIPTSEAPVKKSLWGLLLISMLAGLGGLLTPCVYPMIPMTVSYFLRGNKSRSRSISEALVFGLSIVLIYTLIGALITIFKNPNAVNNFTSHWITNLLFFLIFIALSASFFGMFELVLPSGLANRVDKQADKGGYIGAFFMALAMAMLSFSCTGPIVASLLIKASQGEVLEPIIGMFGFSIVFALPFTLFAIFPSWLQGLPKSGGWLNAVKVVFAFILLAFSLYFLSKIDQTYHLNLLNRSLYLSIWVTIFILLGVYLLGKMKFAHDNELSHLGFPRFILALASFAFALYLFSGLLGNDLKGLSTILPPEKKQLATSQLPQSSSVLCNKPKYSNFLELPHGLEGYFDYDEALRCAKGQNKPVLVDFVGHTCSNCKKMYSEVWSDPRVLQLLQNEFIIASLYTDDKTRLPESEWITSTVDGKVKKTLGKKNQDLQVQRFNSNALPLYAIVTPNGKDLTTRYTYNPDIEKFIRWLNEGLHPVRVVP